MSTKTVNADLNLIPVGSHTTNSSISSATTLTPTNGGTHVLIQAFTADVYYTLDSTAPVDGTTGFTLSSSALSPTLISLRDATLKVISATGAVQYQYCVVAN